MIPGMPSISVAFRYPGSWRVRLCLALYIAFAKAFGNVLKLMAGNSCATTEILRGVLDVQKGVAATLPQNAATHGGVRLAEELVSRVDQLAAQLGPGLSWRFHQERWGNYDVMVLPRTVDSNTGLIIGPKDSLELGAIITNDHASANCDPHAMDYVLNGPREQTQVAS